MMTVTVTTRTVVMIIIRIL